MSISHQIYHLRQEWSKLTPAEQSLDLLEFTMRLADERLEEIECPEQRKIATKELRKVNPISA